MRVMANMLRFWRRNGGGEGDLDAYLDGALLARDRERFEARLANDPALRRHLEAVRALKAALRELPEIEAPRSFRLTPAMVTTAARTPAPARSRPPMVLRAAQLTAGVAAFVLAITFVASIGGSKSSSDTSHEASRALQDTFAAGSAAESAPKAAPAASGAGAGTAAALPAQPSPTLPAYDGGGVSGQSVAPASPSPSVPRPPATGPGPALAETVTDNATTAGGAAAKSPESSPAPSDIGTPSFAYDDDGGIDGRLVLQLTLGAIAIGAALAAVVIGRRRKQG